MQCGSPKDEMRVAARAVATAIEVSEATVGERE